MSRPRLFVAFLLFGLSLAAQASTARAVLIQDAGPLPPNEAVVLRSKEKSPESPTLRSIRPTATSLRQYEATIIASSDPCTQQAGWLPQEQKGVFFCGSLADFYAPKIMPYPESRSAGIAGGSSLALLFLGLAALGLAVRRPVWITRLIR